MRSRIRRCTFFLISIGAGTIGILSRKFPEYLPEEVVKFMGDTMWAFALYYLLKIFFPRENIVWIFLACFSISVLVEISQLYQAEWINAIRDTVVGGLILGNRFVWTDLICYFSGALLAGFIDLFFMKPASSFLK